MIKKHIIIAVCILACFYLGLWVYCSVQKNRNPDKDISYFNTLKDIVLIIGLILVGVILFVDF